MMGDEAVIFDIFTAWRGGMASESIAICVFAVDADTLQRAIISVPMSLAFLEGAIPSTHHIII